MCYCKEAEGDAMPSAPEEALFRLGKTGFCPKTCGKEEPSC